MNRETLLDLRKRLIPLVPKALGRLPYSAALSTGRLLVRNAARPTKAELWARNSFIQKSFVPLLSDLDLTCQLEEYPGVAPLQQIQSSLDQLKKGFPLLGEAHFYFGESSRPWVEMMNPVELDRDPKLRNRYGIASTQASPEENTTALLRYLETDWHNLRRDPQQRAKKWLFHFSKAGLPCPELSLLNLTRACLLPLQLEENENLSTAEKLMLVFESKAKNSPLHLLAVDAETVSLLPHRFCFLIDFPETLNPRLAQVLVHQIAWEVWGLSCQYYRHFSSPGLLTHLENLRRVLESLVLKYSALKKADQTLLGLDRLIREVPAELKS